MAAPLARLKDIKKKQQSILSQNGGASLDEFKSESEPKPETEAKHFKVKEDRVMDIKQKTDRKNKSKNTHDII